jgi:hypothetical protein
LGCERCDERVWYGRDLLFGAGEAIRMTKEEDGAMDWRGFW